MIREIYVGTQESLSEKLRKCLDEFREIPGFPLKLFTHEPPVFPNDEQLRHMRRCGVDVDKPSSYRIYVADRVLKPTKRYAGVELPESSLDSPEQLRTDISLIINKVTGRSGNNGSPKRLKYVVTLY